MLTTEERRDKLEEMFYDQKDLDVNYIKDYFKVSNVTVRNDLIFLERKGIITRQFGKATLRQTTNNLIDLSNIKELDDKEKIGKYAANLIEDNDSILLYTGTTSLQVARFLPKEKHVIVVTNSLYIANELRNSPLAKVVFLGGNLNSETGSTYGAQAISQLEQYNIDKLFLSVDGISASGGITNDHPFETNINNALIDKSKKTIVLADHTKVGVNKFIHIQSVEKIDMLITDNKAPLDEIDKIRDIGVEVVMV